MGRCVHGALRATLVALRFARTRCAAASACTCEKTCCTARGSTPCFVSPCPKIVYVLPLPVWPYCGRRATCSVAALALRFAPHAPQRQCRCTPPGTSARQAPPPACKCPCLWRQSRTRGLWAGMVHRARLPALCTPQTGRAPKSTLRVLARSEHVMLRLSHSRPTRSPACVRPAVCAVTSRRYGGLGGERPASAPRTCTSADARGRMRATTAMPCSSLRPSALAAMAGVWRAGTSCKRAAEIA